MADSSSDEKPVSPPPGGKRSQRTFVWLKERLNATPRGVIWDILNREGRVKEIAFSSCYDEKRMRALIRENFPLLATADFRR